MVLLLKRKIGESLIIDGKIKITIVEIQGKNIKLAVSHPPDSQVLREELYEKIVQANRQAVEISKLFGYIAFNAGLAQLVEQLICNQ